MNCEHADTLISDHLHGELSPADAQLLERHLAECEHCRAEYEADRALLQRVQAAADRCPPDFLDQTMAAVRAAATEPEPTPEPLPLLAPGLPALWRRLFGLAVIVARGLRAPPAVAAAVVIAALALGLWLLQPDRPSAPGGSPDIAGPTAPTRPDEPGTIAEAPQEPAAPQPQTEDAPEPPTVVVRRKPTSFGLVASLSGDASLKSRADTQWRPVAKGVPLWPGDALKTGPDSTLLARFRDGSTIDLAADTELTLGKPLYRGKRPSETTLTRGDVMVAVEPGGGAFEVATMAATAGVRGTHFTLRATERRSVLTVLEGSVAFWNERGHVVAEAAQESVAVLGQPPTEPHWRVHGGKWGSGGQGLHADDRHYPPAEIAQVRQRLQTSPETPELLAVALAPLWHEGGGLALSVECARELARRPERLTQLRRADMRIVPPISRRPGQHGLPIFEVPEDSPADRAGLQHDDVIISVNGQPTEDEVDVGDQLWRAGPGADVVVGFLRDGETRTVTVTCADAEPTGRELALIAALRLLAGDPGHTGARIVVANAQASVGLLAEAATAYEALLAESPDNHVLINNLAALAATDGRLGDALRGFTRAAEIAPDYEGAWLNICQLYWFTQMTWRRGPLLARLAREHPDWERTNTWHATGQAPQLYPDRPHVYPYTAAALKSEERIAALTKVTKLDPANTEGLSYLPWYHLAGAHRAKQRYAEALECYLKGTDIAPEQADMWRSAGDMADRTGQHDRMLVYYEKAVHAGIEYGMGQPHQMEQAIAAATLGARQSGKLGDKEQEERFVQLAYQVAVKAETLTPGAAPIFYGSHLGWGFHRQREEWEEMTRAFRRAMELSPGWWTAGAGGARAPL